MIAKASRRVAGGKRVEAIRVTNCHNEEPALALAEIANTQSRNTTSTTDKTYHLVVTFPPGEKPTPAQLHDIEDRLCEAIGLADHQRLSGVQNDKDQFHFHIAINKVHPTSFRAITPYYDEARLQAACVALEKKHGLTPTNHQMPEFGRGRAPGRAEAMELHGGQQSLAHWVRDEAGPALLAAQETGQGWQDLHRATARFVLEIKSRGAGLTIALAGHKTAHIKPSGIDHRLSFGAVTAKCGPYERPDGSQPGPEKRYPRSPLNGRGPDTAALFRTYQQQRKRIVAERKTARLADREAAKAFRVKLANWACERRQAIKQMPYSAAGRRAAYADLNRTRDLAAMSEQERRAEERAQRAAQPLPNWQEWLRQQASQGHAHAIEVLRSIEQKQDRLDVAILSAKDAGDARHVVYQHLRPTVGRDGSIVYRLDDGGRVTDQARRIRVDEVSMAASYLALSMAADRFGGRPLQVNGTDTFKRQVAQLAAIECMDITFSDPTLEAERKTLADTRVRVERELKAEQQLSSVETFVVSRNSARNRGVPIPHHRAWRDTDAGIALYRGRRHLPDGTEAVLLDIGGEMVVKPVSAGEAATASKSAIGDTVRIDNIGRLHQLGVDKHKGRSRR